MGTSRVALVTGGGRGLGDVMVAALLKDGHRVVISSTDEQSLQDTIAKYAQPGQASTSSRSCRSRVSLSDSHKRPRGLRSDRHSCEQCRSQRGHDTPGLSQRPFKFWEATRAQMEYFFAVNTLPAMLLSAALAPAMIQRGWGRIVANTTSSLRQGTCAGNRNE